IFAALVKPITQNVKEEHGFQVDSRRKRRVLKQSKKPSLKHQGLINLDFSKDFILYAFG
ncbi:hypothetical protein KI387_029806, partial [Taxus chinensis]